MLNEPAKFGYVFPSIAFETRFEPDRGVIKDCGKITGTGSEPPAGLPSEFKPDAVTPISSPIVIGDSFGFQNWSGSSASFMLCVTELYFQPNLNFGVQGQ